MRIEKAFTKAFFSEFPLPCIANLSGLDNGSLELSTDQIVTNGKNTVHTEINTYEGQKIKYEVASYPQTEDFGVFEGEATPVPKDIKVNSETGIGYYEVEAAITTRGGADGKEIVLRYLPEKTDLADE